MWKFAARGPDGTEAVTLAQRAHSAPLPLTPARRELYPSHSAPFRCASSCVRFCAGPLVQSVTNESFFVLMLSNTVARAALCPLSAVVSIATSCLCLSVFILTLSFLLLIYEKTLQ